MLPALVFLRRSRLPNILDNIRRDIKSGIVIVLILVEPTLLNSYFYIAQIFNR